MNANTRVATPAATTAILDAERASGKSNASNVDSGESFRDAMRSLAARNAEQALNNAAIERNTANTIAANNRTGNAGTQENSAISPTSALQSPTPALPNTQSTQNSQHTEESSDADTARSTQANAQQDALQRQARANARKLPPSAQTRQAHEQIDKDASDMDASPTDIDVATHMLRLIGEAINLADDKQAITSETCGTAAYAALMMQPTKTVDQQNMATDGTFEAKRSEDARETVTFGGPETFGKRQSRKVDLKVDDKQARVEAAHVKHRADANTTTFEQQFSMTTLSNSNSNSSAILSGAGTTTSSGTLAGVSGSGKSTTGFDLQTITQSLSAVNASSSPTTGLIENGSSTTSSANLPQTYISVPVGMAGWGNEISRAVIKLAERDVSEAKLTLNPAHLGPIDVSLDLQGAAVTVNFVAATAEARQALEQSLPQLSQMMQEAGMSLSQSSVGQQSTPREGTPYSAEPMSKTATRAGMPEDVHSGAAAVAQRIMPIRIGGVDTFA